MKLMGFILLVAVSAITFPAIANGPTADFSFNPQHPDVSSVIRFKDNSTGNIVNWTWDFGDGSYSYEENPVHYYGIEGIYTVTLTVTDINGSKDSISKEIKIAKSSVPKAKFTYKKYFINLTVVVDGSESYDENGKIVNWTWDWGDGTISYGERNKHRYSSNGTYTVTLTVVDDDGIEGKTSEKIVLENVFPIANFTYTKDGKIVMFFDNSSDEDGAIVNWTWDFGDGNKSREKNPTHIYTDYGTHTVTLTVTDDYGNTVTTSKKVVIEIDGRSMFSYYFIAIIMVIIILYVAIKLKKKEKEKHMEKKNRRIGNKKK